VKIFYLGDPNSEGEVRSVMDALPRGQELTIVDKGRPVEGQISEAEIVIEDGSFKITRQVVDAAKKAKLFQRYGTGMDHADVGYILSKGILLANSTGPFIGVALAEQALLLMLSLARQTPRWHENIERRAIGIPTGENLEGKTLGIVGIGASGSELAKRARALGMRLLAVDVRMIDQARVNELGLEFFGGLDSLDTLLRQSDYVSIHVPLTPQTQNMFGAEEFAKMKDGARLINIARGGIVVESALMDALRSQKLAGAGLDVFPDEPIDPHHPILAMKNVVISPHVAGMTVEIVRKRGEIVGENVQRYIDGRPLLCQITKAD
jgi:D-3-phosphoglycerate dehydrogenase / 2-oxoglutarate reductase